MQETVTAWAGCYRHGWDKGDLVSDAWSHPAKFSKVLIFRIIDYLMKSGYLKKGDTVLDPFAGVSLGAWPIMAAGCHYIGIELESRFWEIGQRNLALWRHRFGYETGTLLQGDSRNLVMILEQARVQGIVTSPPYQDQVIRKRDIGTHEPNRQGSLANGRHSCDAYGTTPGNLGNMTPGEIVAVISSPPYANENIADARHLHFDARRREQSIQDKQNNGIPEGYGASRENLGNMAPGSLVTSPPFCESLSSGKLSAAIRADLERSGHKPSASGEEASYGQAPGQLGAADTDTFWGASTQILQQCFQVLVPGAVAAFVLKDYVRGGKIVPFCAQWRQCCENVGFVFLEEIHAMLVEDHGTQSTLFGGEEQIQTQKKSFFRLLCEKKGSPRIDYETVLLMRKPVTATESGA